MLDEGLVAAEAGGYGTGYLNCFTAGALQGRLLFEQRGCHGWPSGEDVTGAAAHPVLQPWWQSRCPPPGRWRRRWPAGPGEAPTGLRASR